MNEKRIIEMGKALIDYDRHLTLFGKGQADSTLWFWIEGYKHALKPKVDTLEDLNVNQRRISQFMSLCFNEEIANDVNERNHRFLEESLELVQSLGTTKEEALILVDYVFGRAAGEPYQEVGGVMVTLGALCNSVKLDMEKCCDIELARIEEPAVMEKIRIKQLSKPHASPLPQESKPPIWTEEESTLKKLETMTNPQGKSCANCQWGNAGVREEDIHVWTTCGTHLQNFKTNSLCDDWTSPEDPKLKIQRENRRKALREKFGVFNTPILRYKNSKDQMMRVNSLNPSALGEVNLGDDSASFEDLEVWLENKMEWECLRQAFTDHDIITDNYNLHFREPRTDEERSRGYYV